MPSKHLPSWKFRNRAKATPAQLVVIRAQEAAKRRKARHRAYFLREYGRLPEAARRYLDRVQELAGVPIDIISTGPDREQTIVLRHPFGDFAQV